MRTLYRKYDALPEPKRTLLFFGVFIPMILLRSVYEPWSHLIVMVLLCFAGITRGWYLHVVEDT